MAEEVLVLGTTPAGIQAATDLADLGLRVHLLESGPFLEASSGLPPYLENARMLEVLNHPGIKVWTNADLVELACQEGRFLAKVRQNPRYIDLQQCTACGACLEVCPVSIPGTGRKAISLGGQPGCAVIAKEGRSPCAGACPAGIHVQGYTALVGQKRYLEAYQLIQSALPFPSVCGRVCNHYCEAACTRSQVDEAVNLMALKRFVADWALEHQEQIPAQAPLGQDRRSGKAVAIIGAGPAGLTAARDLVRKGHAVRVFDDQPEAGGMMRVGIPPHRISYQQLDWEINRVLAEGVDLQLNTWVDDIPGLLQKGYDAVLIATGAHRTVRVAIEGSDHPDNWLSLDFLKMVSLGEGPDLSGRRVIVLGGGDVAMDAARAAIRLGPSQVSVLCRGLRASFNELQEAQEEGVEIIRDRAFKRIILAEGGICGVECLEAEVGEVVGGKRQFRELPGTEHLVPGDLVIWAVGQVPDFSFLPDQGRIAAASSQGIQADDRMMTTLEGVFTAGDVRRGTTFFVVDAVGEGHQAADSIDHYLRGGTYPGEASRGEALCLTRQQAQQRLEGAGTAGIGRAPIPKLPVSKRKANFQEVDLTLSEAAALQEASRCLICGPCSECLACQQVCQPGAVIHAESSTSATLTVSAVLGGEQDALAWQQPGMIRLAGTHPLAGSAAAYQVLQGLQPGLPAPGSSLPIAERERKEPERIGLVVCQCGGQISSVLDTALLCEEALSWPEICSSAELPFSCTEAGAGAIQELARENGLDSIILAGCSCCSLNQVCFSCTYQRTRCKGNLGLFDPLESHLRVEPVNIREQCAWAHPRSRKKTTAAARALIRSGLDRQSARVRPEPGVPAVPESVLILGSGLAGKACQESLASLGLPARLVEAPAGGIVRSGGCYQADWPEGSFRGDLLVLAPASEAELSHLSRQVTLADQRPLRSTPDRERRLGLFICSPELEPRHSGEGTAAGIMAWISKVSRRLDQPAAAVDPARCRGCGTCVQACGYGLPVLLSDRAYINPRLCFDCGICSAACPSGAIVPGTQAGAELENMLGRMME